MDLAAHSPACLWGKLVHRKTLISRSGNPAIFVLADEEPLNHQTSRTPNDPAPIYPLLSPIIPRLSLNLIESNRGPPQHPTSEDFITSVTALSRERRVNTESSNSQPLTRRRRRSVSEEILQSPGDLDRSRADIGAGIDRKASQQASGGAETLRSVRGGPPLRKRRRIGSRAMRLDSESSAANGSRHSSNGTAHSTRHLNGLSSSPNGHSSPTNGTASAPRNGVSTTTAKAKSSTFFGHNREEVTRLLIQGLTDLGYQGAADRLSQESGYEVESPSVAAFRHAVLQGEWFEAESLLFGSGPIDDDGGGGGGGGVSISHDDLQPHAGLDFADGVDFDELKFQMREQKYLELLEARDLGNALMVLRQELTPLNQDTAKLHHLSR